MYYNAAYGRARNIYVTYDNCQPDVTYLWVYIKCNSTFTDTMRVRHLNMVRAYNNV